MTMDERHVPTSDGELLSVYLAGELPPAEEAALEQRLAADARLRAALERQREIQESLAAALAPAPSADVSQRLRARLAAERGQAGVTASSEETAAAPQPADRVVSIDSARTRRRRFLDWRALGGVAAAVTAVAVIGTGLLNGAGITGDSADDVEVVSADADDGADSAQEFFSQATEDAAPAEQRLATPEDATANAPADAPPEPTASLEMELEATEAAGGADESAVVAPQVVEEGVTLAGQDEAQDHLTARSEGLGLIGLSGAEAREVADAFTVAVRAADPFSDGTSPAVCLDEVTAAAAGPVVPAVVEALTYDATPSLAYLLVSAPDGSETLERVLAWIVEPSTCSTSLYLVLPAG